MKATLLLIMAVALMGCGESQHFSPQESPPSNTVTDAPVQSSPPTPETKPLETKVKVEIIGENKSSPLSVKISNHPNNSFNGVYITQKIKINNYPCYKKADNRFLYYYNQGEGGYKGWSLDHRKPNGIKDWFSGGWSPIVGSAHPKLGVSGWLAVDEGIFQVVMDGNIKETEIFLTNGVNANTVFKFGPNEGLTVLDAAIEFGHKDIVTLLRNHGGKTAKEF